ncbi:MAG: ComEC/Rec2 family competence protein [Planktomarina sp.]
MADRPQLRTVLSDHLSAQVPQAFLWYPVAFACGIGVYFSLPVEPGYWPVLIFLIIGVFWANGANGRPISLVFAIVVIGYGWAGTNAHRLTAPVLEKRIYGLTAGRVIATDRSASDKVRLTLDQVVLEKVTADRTPKRVRIALHGRGPPPPIGARIEVPAHISPPPGPAEPYGFDFQRHAWFLQLGGVGYTRKDVTILSPPKGAVLARVRGRMSAWISSNMPAETAGVAIAISTGDRTYLDKTVTQNLREANLAHLLAISGLHMGLLAGLIFGGVRLAFIWMPRGDPKRVAAFAALCIALVYLLLSGASIATERAFVMTSVILIAVMFRKRALTLRAVALAVWIVLLLRPQALFSPGFHMSFAATIALILAFQKLADWGLLQSAGPVRYLGSAVMSAFIAGAATAPFAAAHFNMIPHYGVVANVLAVPIMAIVVMPGLIAALALAPLGGAWIGFTAMDLGLGTIITIATEVAGWSGAVSHVKGPSTLVLPLFTIGVVFWLLWRGPPRWGGMILALCALFLWYDTKRPDILIADNAGLVGTMGPQGRVLSREKGSGFSANVWLENDGDTVDQFTAANRRLVGPDIVEPIRKWEEEMDPCGPIPKVVPAYLKWPECDVFDLRRLRNTGSVAGYITSEGIKWISARSVSGRRLWNNKWVRRDAMADRFWLRDQTAIPDQ